MTALTAAIVVSLLAVSGAGGIGAQTPKRGGTIVVGKPAGTEPACFNLLVESCGIQPAFVRQVLEGAFEVGPDLSARHAHQEALHAHLPHSSRGELERQHPDYRARLRLHWQTYSKLELSDFPPAIRRVRTLDAKTVKVDFRARFAGWRDLFGVVLPRHALVGEDPTTIWRNGVDNPKSKRPIGSGPFLVGSVERSRQFTLVHNPRYWGAHQAYLDRLVVRFLAAPFPGSGPEALRGGIVDAIFESVTRAAVLVRSLGSRTSPARLSHDIPLTGQCLSLERAFSADVQRGSR